ncbi:hypothetical protein CAPTEDRAFT_228812 [Capitella teleta]|uniref:Large ribosomal subunit protein bL20m n=1 Tax=Capitella teleta TaxID=283909 RepID=R7V0D6_CAPTE|nr:hypothetical protein CAPTEDRAFT_200615 [Capitella teleta]ELU09131.1 hypothetical protein CAPTEDRAFT_228812 [Capitella teleta]|eukprot:ELT91430.1 hypothetical protein CAPTEDRAFT_200615 [Capitella teleta]
MVFLSLPLFSRSKRLVMGSNRFYKIQQMLRFTWHYRHRGRNCYSIGIRNMRRALRYSTMWRKLKKIQQTELFNQRLEAAANEHNMNRVPFMEGLARSQIQLDRKVLTDLAIYEPRTFQSLTDVSKKRLSEEGMSGMMQIMPRKDVITQQSLRKWSAYYKARK